MRHLHRVQGSLTLGGSINNAYGKFYQPPQQISRALTQLMNYARKSRAQPKFVIRNY
jgi:hypothetical protein